MRALICIPTYNERENIIPLVRDIFKSVPEGFEILFIDDGSPDGTGQVIDELIASEISAQDSGNSKAQSKIHVLHRSGKQGLAAAYLAGFDWGLKSANNYDWILEMDADFSHDAVHLKEFQQWMQSSQVDAIVGSRYIDGGGVVNWSGRRLLLSRLGTIYSRFWLAYDLNDWTGGFNVWRRSLLERLHLSTIASKGYAFQIEMKYRSLVLGAKVKELPIIFRERRSGASKMSGSIVKEAIFGVARLKVKHSEGTLLLAETKK